MTALFSVFSGLLSAQAVSMLLSAMIFAAVAAAAFFAMNAVSKRSALRRRLLHKDNNGGKPSAGLGKNAYQQTANRVAERAKQHLTTDDPAEMRKLRTTLVQAGFYDSNAVFLFFAARLAVAIGLAAGAAAVCWLAISDLNVLQFWTMVGSGGIAGYLLPRFYLGYRVKQRTKSYRIGFPDFLDLMVICADAGLSMEASLDRISREIADTHPSLSVNLSIASVELRAGNSMYKTLENLSARIGLQEASSFATLIQQSVELGSSINEALRVYSADMRHTRLSAAEEKAYSLAAKLSVPLMLCILPVLMVVILLPIVVKVMGMQ